MSVTKPGLFILSALGFIVMLKDIPINKKDRYLGVLGTIWALGLFTSTLYAAVYHSETHYVPLLPPLAFLSAYAVIWFIDLCKLVIRQFSPQ